MKTYECIVHSGMTGKQMVFLIRAASGTDARMAALEQAKLTGAGSLSIVSVKEM